METKNVEKAVLKIPADNTFSKTAVSFVENAAERFALGEKETFSLALACDEVFAYLCPIGNRDRLLEISCSFRGYYLQVDFLCSVSSVNFRALNLTSRVLPDDENSLNEMGLILASRSVDRLLIKLEGGNYIRFMLFKEKRYPELNALPEIKIPSYENYQIRPPEKEALKTGVYLANQIYGQSALPYFFKYPGKVVDMLAGEGGFYAGVAGSTSGPVLGMIFWTELSEKIIEGFGPYVFTGNNTEEIETGLLEYCLNRIARTSALGLLFRNVTTQKTIKERAELLGDIDFYNKNKKVFTRTAYYRQLTEDPGSTAWSSPELLSFLKGEYSRLILPRDIQTVRDEGETGRSNSVFTAEFDRLNSAVTLQPALAGDDINENIGKHIELFENEKISNIFFEIDTGEAWQSGFVPGLLANKFSPRLVLPYSGTGDKIILQKF